MHTCINIIPYNAEKHQNELVQNAQADGHSVFFPSFVLQKDGRIVGYISVAVPIVLSWQDSKLMKPLDSIKELGFIEGALAASPMVCIPCDPESPYMRLLPNQGYQQYFKPVNLFIKTRNP